MACDVYNRVSLDHTHSEHVKSHTTLVYNSPKFLGGGGGRGNQATFKRRFFKLGVAKDEAVTCSSIFVHF